MAVNPQAQFQTSAGWQTLKSVNLKPHLCIEHSTFYTHLSLIYLLKLELHLCSEPCRLKSRVISQKCTMAAPTPVLPVPLVARFGPSARLRAPSDWQVSRRGIDRHEKSPFVQTHVGPCVLIMTMCLYKWGHFMTINSVQWTYRSGSF